MLRDKRVLVIGGSSGIGLAVARLAAENGAQVIIAARRAGHLHEEFERLTGACLETHEADITVEADINRLCRAVGEIDHLIITVRPSISAALLLAADITQARRAFDTKFWGVLGMIRAFRPQMRAQGSIILTSGIAGEKIYPGAGVMAALNCAVESLCRTLAVELSPLRVNCVSPGFVAPKSPEAEQRARAFPLGRIAAAHEAALAYLHLMANTYLTGTISVVDGGARLI